MIKHVSVKDHLSREIEIIKKKEIEILELKYIIYKKFFNSYYELNRKMDMIEKRVVNLKTVNRNYTR